MDNKEFLVTISMVNGDKHNVILKRKNEKELLEQFIDYMDSEEYVNLINKVLTRKHIVSVEVQNLVDDK
ncbi:MULTISPECIES: hypothetical protein [Staphylococcus]|uniref:Uncharacterized protein n=1 Tax=Staphylococcus warneri TaxID=1292 RepID=A0A2T4Q029_STAWA|nr:MULTISPECIES: hypothetical protein [Staphylococcus]MBM6506816.1 hypothetical protein [Staphylococcus pasteuri]MCM3070830.1 hypothetical protein [Staphylococcus warneri]PTI24006.1 hypothetical protein BU080_07855 [Staphylococcus warneri]PTI50883.1 hypothetical protein BU085_07065 [Staphylococcus warneri]PTI61498.1 hypothetical protein BU090_01795 [Staphylococcus warneri]